MSKELLLIPPQSCGAFNLKAQYVSFKEETAHLKKRLCKKDIERFLCLYQESQISPKKTFSSLEELKVLYPNVPEIYNLLTFTYLKLRKIKKAEALILEAYQKCPDNLFVRINYADYCLRKKMLQKIPEIFNHAYDLTLLYPSRTTFHLSEFRGFMTLMGFYHLALHHRDSAICYHYLARYVDPCHPAVRLLGRKLYYTSLFKKLINHFNKTK
jgi:tetratricopeptide (TPR) repeat protein